MTFCQAEGHYENKGLNRMNRNTDRNRKTKRRINLLKLSSALFLFSGILYLFSAIFLRSYNNSLSTRTQSINADIVTMQAQNDALQVDIETLSSSERVEGIAASNGMKRNQDSIITITDTTGKE